jgi:hypothetical protein
MTFYEMGVKRGILRIILEYNRLFYLAMPLDDSYIVFAGNTSN